MVIKPREKGGMGVINLKVQNEGLLMKQLHKFYSKQDVPWVHLIWDTYYPTSFVLNQQASVRAVQEAKDLASMFSLPLSEQAYKELLMLHDLLLESNIDDDISKVFGKLWKRKCTMRTKFLFWLLLVDRFNTKGMLFRRNMLSSHELSCVMCVASTEEDVDHLFFQCSFGRCCWQKLNIQWNMSLPLHQRILHVLENLGGMFCMELIVITTWVIWKTRNRKVFDGILAAHNCWIMRFMEEVKLQSLRLNEVSRHIVISWLSSL
ncbi:hypothetical protein BS78_10G156600 [Paspalum vaginatum]|nr:hypothetical protein BS78_10G156600 [Paspalum vaginatum]